MKDRLSLAIKIFRVELEEVENDVAVLLEYYTGRFDKKEITPYVFMENRAILMREIACVKELESDVAEWKAPDTDDFGEILESLTVFLKGLVKERGYPEMVIFIIDRIKDRVSRYLN